MHLQPFLQTSDLCRTSIFLGWGSPLTLFCKLNWVLIWGTWKGCPLILITAPDCPSRNKAKLCPRVGGLSIRMSVSEANPQGSKSATSGTARPAQRHPRAGWVGPR